MPQAGRQKLTGLDLGLRGSPHPLALCFKEGSPYISDAEIPRFSVLSLLRVKCVSEEDGPLVPETSGLISLAGSPTPFTPKACPSHTQSIIHPASAHCGC